jgi:hypothetical protein
VEALPSDESPPSEKKRRQGREPWNLSVDQIVHMGLRTPQVASHFDHRQDCRAASEVRLRIRHNAWWRMGSAAFNRVTVKAVRDTRE